MSFCDTRGPARPPGALGPWHLGCYRALNMYGLVNKAIEGLVCSQRGEASWEEVKRRAGLDLEGFIGLDAYPDEITYALVAAASAVLNVPAEELLEAFGEHWVEYTGREGYGGLLDAAGSTLPEFLLGLNNLHSRVRLLAPELRPPSFQCTDITDGSLVLHYRSEREGLAPMVVGLLRGLGRRFRTPVTVTHTRVRGRDGADHDELLVTFAAAAAAG